MVKLSTSTRYTTPLLYGKIQFGVLHLLLASIAMFDTQITGANRAGKSGRTLFNCISVTDGIKINEQYKSIGIPINGIWSDLITPTESYGGFESGGVSNIAILARINCKTPKCILP